MKISFRPTEPSRVGDGGYETFVWSAPPVIARQLDRIDPADHAAFIEYCEAGSAWEAISDGARGNLEAATRRMEKADKAWFATESYRNRPPLRHPDTGEIIG